jgi:acetate kinase
MLALTINCGSSSVKYSLFAQSEDGELTMLARGMVSELGSENSAIQYTSGETRITMKLDRPGYRQALEAAIDTLIHPQYGKLKSIHEIDVVGHRTVHGGDKFTGSVLIDDAVITKMEECIDLAPIHNPANLEGIRQARALLPNTPQVAVFDTAFHQSIPIRARVYALPYEYYENYGIKKFGFHGTSCQYASQQVCHLAGRDLAESRIVICHLGNGVSVTAVDRGHSVDTSLGYTSVGGLMMGTRCGDLDPGVLLAIMKEFNLTVKEADHILHHKSGLLGVSGVSNDMQTITRLALEGNHRCRLAVEMFAYSLTKYIGSYAAVMGGIDMLVFTGGIGENSAWIRSLAVEKLDFLGIRVDHDRNNEKLSEDEIISPQDSPVIVAVIKANEEKMIASEAVTILKELLIPQFMGSLC